MGDPAPIISETVALQRGQRVVSKISESILYLPLMIFISYSRVYRYSFFLALNFWAEILFWIICFSFFVMVLFWLLMISFHWRIFSLELA